MIPSLQGGGAERQLALLLRYIDRERFTPALCALEMSGPYCSLIPDDVETIDLGKRSRWDLPRLAFELAAVVRRVRPDVIFSKVEYANILTHWATRMAGRRVPVVMGEEANLRDALELASHPRARRKLLKSAYRSAAAVVSPSRGAASVLQEEALPPHMSPVVIRNMVDIEEVRTLAAAPGEALGDSHVLRLVSVGRLTVEKGFGYLLDALKIVMASVPCQLIVLGDGDQREHLEERVVELGLEGSVLLPGFKANPFSVMASADVLVMSSVSESFGAVLIEGMALGLPIVSTRAPHGPEEILDHMQTGLLVAPGDAEDLAGGLLTVLRDAGLRERLGKNAQEAARAFSTSEVVPLYEDLFERVARS